MSVLYMQIWAVVGVLVLIDIIIKAFNGGEK